MTVATFGDLGAEGGTLSWIAIKMLVGDRAKFLGIVMGLSFAALLITQQGSIFCGLMLRTCAQIIDIGKADLWVMHSGRSVYRQTFEPMLENNLATACGSAGRSPLGGPALQGNCASKDQSRLGARQPGNGDRASDSSGARRRQPGRRPAPLQDLGWQPARPSAARRGLDRQCPAGKALSRRELARVSPPGQRLLPEVPATPV